MIYFFKWNKKFKKEKNNSIQPKIIGKLKIQLWTEHTSAHLLTTSMNQYYISAYYNQKFKTSWGFDLNRFNYTSNFSRHFFQKSIQTNGENISRKMPKAIVGKEKLIENKKGSFTEIIFFYFYLFWMTFFHWFNLNYFIFDFSVQINQNHLFSPKGTPDGNSFLFHPHGKN